MMENVKNDDNLSHFRSTMIRCQFGTFVSSIGTIASRPETYLNC